MEQPAYQDIKVKEIPVINGEGYQLKVVAGEYRGVKGPARTYTPLLALQASLKKGGKLDIELPNHFNAFAYVLHGEVKLNDNWSYEKETLLNFKNDGDGFSIEGEASETTVLIMAGEPIDEPIAQWGPYVMNNETEIMEAMRDYNMGKMGVYID
jgi:redox-sensitive bicupin YhaK (pirin superfamily)